ncbi:ornithine cyclodeaminase family protein [Sedimenticola sp.]|uniref:ornithine cyclodeaminase family protein n=1 Tax=Sedimenticola sp. TaxID=1940285 RepID=UPI003D12744A
MNALPYVRPADVEPQVRWRDMVQAMRRGHRLPRADIDDIIFRHERNTLLNRAAWIEQLGIAVKTATIFPGNGEQQPPLPSVNTLVTLFDDQTGVPRALLDGAMVTKWKTATDSVLGAQLLARPDSERLLIVGAGTVARSLVSAYSALFPGLKRIQIWNRTDDKAAALADELTGPAIPVNAVSDLAGAVSEADIVSTATLSQEPILRGDWVTPGTHVDLIGAFRPDMREADDVLLLKSELFVDARETTLEHIGELCIPLQRGVIDASFVRGDLYDLCNGGPGRSSDQSITLYKNGGGAHLDLMTADYLLQVFAAGSASQLD